MSEVESFDVLEVKSAKVKYAGEVLEFKALPIGKIPPFARAIRPVFAVLVEIDQALERGEDVFEKSLDFLEDHGDRLQDAVSIATGKSREFIAEGGIMEFFALLRAVMEVNRDFFGLPSDRAAKRNLAETEKKSPGRGRKASSS